jgi:RNA polymerase sigma-70 factor (ECF subfamily)
MALDIADGEVQGIKSIVNPEKLRHVGSVTDFREFLRRGRDRSDGGVGDR